MILLDNDVLVDIEKDVSILNRQKNMVRKKIDRVADELIKIGIDLNPTTVNRIIQTFRKQGKIQPTGSWKKFLKSHWNPTGIHFLEWIL